MMSKDVIPRFKFYYLDENLEIVETDFLGLEQYVQQYGDPAKHIAFTCINEITVSTVFLARNYQCLPNKPPLFFETMVFGGKLDGYQWRHSTYKQAVDVHQEIVNLVRMSENMLNEMQVELNTLNSEKVNVRTLPFVTKPEIIAWRNRPFLLNDNDQYQETSFALADNNKGECHVMVRLETPGGGFVSNVCLDNYQTPPIVIRWGDRIFKLTGERIYTEAFIAVAAYEPVQEHEKQH